jgi:hypothetical protein
LLPDRVVGIRLHRSLSVFALWGVHDFGYVVSAEFGESRQLPLFRIGGESVQAKDYPLNVVLQERQQWVIPVYQRTYAWDTRPDKQLPKLWDDLRDRALERLDGLHPKPHFVGAIIYSQPTDQPFGTVNKRFLVDGQQRITTFSLALCALRECAREAKVERLIATIDEYIFNAHSASMAEPEREKFKLWSSSFDRPLYTIIATRTADEVRAAFPDYFYKNGNIILGQAPKVLASYWYLKDEISTFVAEKAREDVSAESALDSILSGFLSGFQIVVVQLGQEDDAQAIFASLNGNAEPLTSFDLIRNDIFHRARKANEDDDALYEQHWKALEDGFWKTEVKQGRLKRPRTDHLITHTVVAETAHDIIVGQVANEYAKFAKERGFVSVSDEVQALLKYADAYREMEQRIKGGKLAQLASFLEMWDTSALHPVILWSAVNGLSEDQRDRLFQHLESYVVRRDICDLTNKNYNRVVASWLIEMHRASDPYRAFLTDLRSAISETSRFPSDSDILAAVARKPLYTQLGSKKLRYILMQIERSIRTKFDETVSIETQNLTVEHILPRRWAENWPLPSGAHAQAESVYELLIVKSDVPDFVRREMESREAAKHTLGNLTLLTSSLNPALGNIGWPEKQARIQGSLLAINREVASSATWDEAQISQRSLALGAAINQIWQYPEEVPEIAEDSAVG